jgi:hypothetical protein
MKSATVTILTSILFSQTPLLAQGIYWQPTSGPLNGEVYEVSAGSSDTIYAATTNGVHVSGDRGESWHRTLAVEATTILRHPQGAIFAGTVGDGVRRSTDGGVTWWPTAMSRDTVWTLALNHDGRLYAGSNGYIGYSDDLGDHWTTVSFTIKPIFSLVFTRTGGILAASYGKGVYFSTDAGSTWSSSNQGVDTLKAQHLAIAPDGDIYLATETGVFRSTNNGALWSRVSPNWNAAVHKVGVTHAGTLFAIAHNGVYRTIDKGGTWTQINEGLTTSLTGALLISNNGYVYVGTWGSGVFRSIDKTDPHVHDWLSGDLPGDGFGTSVAAAGDVNGDGWQDFIVGSPYTDLRGPSSGSARLYLGGPNMGAESSVLLIGEEKYDLFGTSVAGIGDINGDGYDDIAVGAPTDFNMVTFDTISGLSPSGKGRVYVYLGAAIMDATPDVVLSPDQVGFGRCVSSAGDLNNDGYKDFLVTAPYARYDGTPVFAFRGFVYVYFGRSIPLNRQDLRIKCPRSDMFAVFGRIATGIGDFDADGYDDIAASYQSSDGIQIRGINLMKGGASVDSSIDMWLSEAREEIGGTFPASIASGDVDGDGIDDIIVSNSHEYDLKDGRPIPAAVFCHFGDSASPLLRRQALRAPSMGQGFGSVAACIGDINGDGYDDIAVGQTLESTRGVSSGSVPIYLGGAPLDNVAAGHIPGVDAFDKIGGVIAGAADYDGDGKLEVLLGCPGGDPGGVFAGRLYLAETGLASPLVPTLPQHLSPPDGFRGSIPTPVLTWNRSKNTQWYHLQVSTDSQFVDSVTDYADVRDTTMIPEHLDSTTTYFWRVRAQNQAASSAWTTAWRFRTIPSIPHMPTLRRPLPDAYVLPGVIALGWEVAYPEVDLYRAQVSYDSTFFSTLVDSTIREELLRVDGLQDLRRCWWRVAAENSSGWGPFCEPWQFTVLSLPGQIELNSPGNDASFSSSIVKLTWHKGAPQVARYALEISPDSLFLQYLVDSTITDTSITRTDLSGNSRYFWRVRGWNGSGWGAYSEVRSFSLLAFPSIVSLQSPLAAAIVAPGLVHFTWLQAWPLVDRYWFEIATDSNFVFRSVDSLTSDTSKSIDGLSAGATYWWRIRARNPVGWGPFSDRRSLSVLTSPGAVELVAPAHLATAISGTVQFSWTTSSPMGDRYWFEIASDSLFMWTFRDTSLVDTSKIMQGLTTSTMYWWRVKAGNAAGWGPFSMSRALRMSISSSPYASGAIPSDYILEQSYPNPFNPSTTITFGLPSASHVSLTIYSSLGQRVGQLVTGLKPPGFHTVSFDGSNLPSGLYICRMRAGDYVATRKLLLIK